MAAFGIPGDSPRSFMKRMLRPHPRTFSIAQKIYVVLKRTADRFAFSVCHPRAKWIFYSEPDLTRMRGLGSNSQYGQDIFLWELLRHLRASQHGFFVDIGANHPTRLSNSFFFEQAGWSGIAIDPLKRFAEDWRDRRGTRFCSAAVSRAKGVYTFVEINIHEGWEHTLSGFKDFVRRGDMSLYGFREYEVQAAPLSHFLEPHEKPDLLFVDVEGAELEVLQGVDFGALNPRVVMVENVSRIGGCSVIREYLRDRGYVLTARLGGADDVYVRC